MYTYFIPCDITFKKNYFFQIKKPVRAFLFDIYADYKYMGNIRMITLNVKTWKKLTQGGGEMKKIKITIAATTIAMFGLFGVIGCSGGGGGGGSDAPVAAQDIVNPSGGNNDGSGVSSNDNITVANGNIIVNVVDGKITINGDNVTLTEQNGTTWTLVDGITITVTNNSGGTVAGTVYVDPDTGVITFRPDSPLDVSETYTITVTVNGNEYTATVIVAVDETDEEESMFAGVPYRNAGTYAITDLIVNGKAIFGWQFGNSFTISFSNAEEGATVYLTAYGIYDIEGQENEVYYQRWGDSNSDLGIEKNYPVKDFIWGGFGISVNQEDSTLDDNMHDYSFAATYFELRVMKDGEDITSTSGIKVKVVEN